MTSLGAIRKAAIPLLKDYGFSGATIFGSYARGDATADSDLDILLHVSPTTKTKRVFEFAYDLSEALGVQVDAYGTHEIPQESGFYKSIMSEGVRL